MHCTAEHVKRSGFADDIVPRSGRQIQHGERVERRHRVTSSTCFACRDAESAGDRIGSAILDKHTRAVIADCFTPGGKNSIVEDVSSGRTRIHTENEAAADGVGPLIMCERARTTLPNQFATRIKPAIAQLVTASGVLGGSQDQLTCHGICSACLGERARAMYTHGFARRHKAATSAEIIGAGSK